MNQFCNSRITVQISKETQLGYKERISTGISRITTRISSITIRVSRITCVRNAIRFDSVSFRHSSGSAFNVRQFYLLPKWGLKGV